MAAFIKHVEPVFFSKRDLPFTRDDISRSLEALEICVAAELVSSKETVTAAQEIKGLWRLYPTTREARNKLLVAGLTLKGTSIRLYDKNPYILRNQSGQEIPATKVYVSDIPLSCDNKDIETALIRLGCVLRSQVMYEKIRNKDGKLTRFYTGRRFVFINVPAKPLDTSVTIGGFRAALYHKEQPKKSSMQATCGRCLTLGHWASECTATEPVCRACGKSGHKRGDPLCQLDKEKEGEGRGNDAMNDYLMQSSPTHQPADNHTLSTNDTDATLPSGDQNNEEKENQEKVEDTEERGRADKRMNKQGEGKNPSDKVLRQTKLQAQTRSRSLTPGKRHRSPQGDSPVNRSDAPGKSARWSVAGVTDDKGT